MGTIENQDENAKRILQDPWGPAVYAYPGQIMEAMDRCGEGEGHLRHLQLNGECPMCGSWVDADNVFHS